MENLANLKPLNIFFSLFHFFRKKYGTLSYPALVSLGMLSGIVGSFIGTPADVVMVRMIADIKLAPGNDSARKMKHFALML